MHRVVSVSTGAHKYLQQISVGTHRLHADEPVEIGGRDAAPDPYELLMGALGACTAITVQLFADRRSWPLEKVHVRLSHGKTHAHDCINCNSGDAKLDRVELEISFEGDLTDEQRRKLVEIAGRCPLHRTLESGLQLQIR